METMHPIGSFRAGSGAMLVLDPGLSLNHALRIENVRKGEWTVRAFTNEFFTTVLEASCGSDDASPAERFPLDVDCAMSAICDPDSIEKDDDLRVKQCIDATRDTPFGCAPYGAVFHYKEDDTYPVQVYRDANGVATKITINE